MKAQTSTEFLVLVSILVLISLVFYFSIIPFLQQAYHSRIKKHAEEICKFVANELNLAYQVGDGYRRKFFIEEKLLGFKNYTIDFQNFSIFVDWNGWSVVCPTQVGRVNGRIHKGWNYIKNVKGEIYIE